jgi:diguanylate cyclase (GGDEF)-like protein
LSKSRIFRIPSTERGRLAILALSILLPILAATLVCNSLLSWMLRYDAQTTSSSWVSMFVSRNPQVLAIFTGASPSTGTQQHLNEASQVGDIYRLRLWDTSGHLVFSSERLHSAGPPAVDKLPISDVLRSGSVQEEGHTGSPPHDVPYYVESLIPIKQNGAVIGVFDVYLDQSDDKQLYQRSLFLTEAIMGVLVLLAGGIPACMAYRQILEQRAAKAQALYLAEHDSLTGLPNRKQLNDVARTALAASRRNQTCVAALMIDLDRFKEINDSFGHSAGDEVLRNVAIRLLASVRESDSVARFGGDEFIVLQVGLAQPHGASVLAERIIRALSEPYDFGNTPLTSGASIGIAIAPADAGDFDSLLACADVALYKSKAHGRNSVTFFEPGMDAAVRERCQLESDIRRACDTASFQLAYQPLHSFGDGSLVGFEALLRWPEGWSPQQSPSVFIPIAEDSGLILQIGAWVLETACRAAAGWTSPLKVAVNLSPVQFRHGDIVSIVAKALRDSGLPPERLELEVTESLWIQNPDAVLEQLKRLSNMGVSVALDDFGTGYSSLTHLWKFPFENVKIDRSFVNGMESEPKATAIIKAIVALGKMLNLTITAEGVETPLQAQILRAAGCDQAQGFLFGRPLSAASANALANPTCQPARAYPA